MNQNAPCNLCGKTAKLLKKSHIIPNFMYKGIHDELNRMVVAQLNSPNRNAKFQQSGYFEKYILCLKCDNDLIGSLERYAALFLFGGKSYTPPTFKRAMSKDGIKSLIIENLDYSKFKLCLLSMLWRAHVSTNKFFENVDIGENEKVIRKMLIENDAKDEVDFKISIVGIRNSEGMVRMVLDPGVIKIGNGSVAMFFINGFFYFIDLNLRSDFKLFEKHYIKMDGKYEVMILEGEKANELLTAFGIPEDVAYYYTNPKEAGK
jgi:hypothetical protein